MQHDCVYRDTVHINHTHAQFSPQYTTFTHAHRTYWHAYRIRAPWRTLTACLIYTDLGGRVKNLGTLFRLHTAGLASTFLVLDASAETCLTRKLLSPLKLPVVVPDLAVVALLHARTTSADDAIGAELTLFPPTIPHGHAARSSRTKTFPVTSTASFC